MTGDFDPPVHVVRSLVASALAEDLGPLGDLTAALVPADANATVDVVARADGVLAGTACATEMFAPARPGRAGALARRRRRCHRSGHQGGRR